MKNIYDIIIIIVSIIALLLSILSLTKSEKFGVPVPPGNAVCDDKDWQKSRWPKVSKGWGDHCHKWLTYYGCGDDIADSNISNIKKNRRNTHDVACSTMRELYPQFRWNYKAPPGLSLEPKLFGIF